MSSPLLSSTASTVVCSSLEPHFFHSVLECTPSRMVTLVLSNNRKTKVKNRSFSGSPSQKITMVCVAPGGCFGIQGPQVHALLKPQVHVLVRGLTAARRCVSVPSPRYHQRPYRYPWLWPPCEAMLISGSVLLAGGHPDGSRLMLLPEALVMSRSVLPPRAMSRSKVLLCQWAMLVICSATGDHAEDRCMC